MKNTNLFRRLVMTQGKVLEGIFAVNKPTGPTSAAVLNELQAKFNPSALFAPWIQNEHNIRSREHHNQRQKRRMKKVQVKIGHGGTLDPLATGVLVTAVGKGTKSLQKYLECTKEYEAVVVFGAATDTYDRVGKVVRRSPYEHVTKELVEEKLKAFKGKLMQLPPLYSAIKMNGKPLYEYARQNIPLPRPVERRPVECLEVELVEWLEPGTHSHKAPDAIMDPAEAPGLLRMWQKEGIAPTDSGNGKGSERDEKDRLELFERRKRKMSEEQDALVQDAPPHKVRRASQDQDATMSGGLPDPSLKDEEAAASNTPAANEVAAESRPTTPVQALGPPAARIRMTVTSGFYVRSLCHELGPAVGSAACMAELIRTRQGEWELGKNVVDYDDLMKDEEVWGPKVEASLEGWENAQREARREAHLADTQARKSGQSSARPVEKSTETPATAESDVKKETIEAQKQTVESDLVKKDAVPEEPLKTEVVGESAQSETNHEDNSKAETYNESLEHITGEQKSGGEATGKII